MDEKAKILKQVDKVIDAIVQDESYRKLEIVKQELANHSEILARIERIKSLQKKYVQNGMKEREQKNKIEEEKAKLEQIPLYATYLELLEQVNDTLRMIECKLNDLMEQIIQ